MSFNELSIPLAPNGGLWCCEENGSLALSLPLILSKVETREREAFPFPVSFSESDRWREHPAWRLFMLSKLDQALVPLFAGKDAERGVCPVCLSCGLELTCLFLSDGQ